MTARTLAISRLIRVEEEGAHVARLSHPSADAATARAALDYVAGVTRQKRYLDFALSSVVRRPLGSLDPPLRQALRVGAFDLLRGTPPHAAVGEAVGSVADLMHRGAAGFANGALRALARRLADGALPEPNGPLADRLAVRHSHPTWMVRRWLDAWGEDTTEAFLRSNNAVPRYTLALRGGADARPDALADLAELGADPAPSRWHDGMVSVGRLQPVLRAGWLDAGRARVQDEAAALVVDVLDPQPGESVLDAAAAPGGKAVGAALALGGVGRVVALDVSETKARLVGRAAQAAGAEALETAVGDLRTWAADAPFDAVLLDAPCSGTGVLAKRADLRWNRSPDDLAELGALQAELLDAAARHVRPGGRLVYSTCSVEAEENDLQAGRFLERHPDFAVEPVGDRVPAEMRDALASRPDGADIYRALPHIHDTDGAFAVRFRRSP